MEQVKWVDRKFPFGYDKGYIPLFIERLNSTASRLEELLKNMDEKSAGAKHGDEWSVKEHAGHLTDLESLHDGRVDDIIAGIPILRAADMTNKETYSANHNDQTIPELLSRFRNRRNQFIKRLELLDAKYFERKALHPRLQEMVTLTDLLFFMAEHDNHHLAKIAGRL